MGAKTSKSQTIKFQAAGNHDAFIQQINLDLERKRPTSRRIPELSPPDEEDDEEGALVYVFNPDRLVSQRISKRIPSTSVAITPVAKTLTQYTLVNSRELPSPGKSIDCCIMGRSGSDQTENKHLCQDEAHFEISNEDILCFGVFDGHGPDGHLVAAVCAQQLASCLIDDQQYYLSQNDWIEAIKSGMESLARRLGEISLNVADIENSGCTATIGLVNKDTKTVYLANVGDTRAIGAKKEGENKYTLVQLSAEHIFSVQEEADRISASGGVVRAHMAGNVPVGPPRCFYNYEDADAPGLMVSRALGDTLARQIGVNHEPAVFSASDLAFIVIASDGLWEVMTNEEVITLVGGVKRGGGEVSSIAISERLCLEAQKRWMALENRVGDDISCIVLTMDGF